MARPRAFDIDEALEKAMQVFWARGFEGASLPDLLNGMGLTRGSLYKAFTDKKTLFLRVLERYETQAIKAGVSLLSDPAISNGSDRIIRVFQGAYQRTVDGDLRGCLLCTSAAGPSNYDDDIASAVSKSLGLLKDAIKVALAESPKHAQLSDGERSLLADMVLAQYVGLRTMARARIDQHTLQNIVRSVGLMLA